MQETTNSRRAAGVEAPPLLRARVVQLVAAVGSSDAAKQLGIGLEALARVAGGLGVRRGTIALVERNIERES
jgi:hypothetical protein